MKNRSRTLLFAFGALTVLLAGLWRWKVDQPFETIRYSATSPARAISSGPAIVSIGAFDNPELENRVPSFPSALTTYLTRLKDPNLRYIDRKRATNSAPAANWVLGGTYATTPNAKIHLILKLQRVGGSQTSLNLEGSSHDTFHQQIHAAIARAIAARQNETVAYQSRRVESDYLCEQGAQISDFEHIDRLYINPDESEIVSPAEAARRAFRLEQAIRALECSLAANPTNAQAKVYLGACDETSFIDRPRDARRLYREVIATPLRDQWAKIARLRLAKNLQAQGDSESALKVLRKAEDQADDAESAALFRRAGDNIVVPREIATPEFYQNQKTAFTESLDRTLSELQRTNPIIGNVSIGSISSAFGSIKDDDARRKAIWDFAQELKPRYPTLYPYMLLDDLANSIKLPAWKAELKRVLADSLADTNTVARPAHLFTQLQYYAQNILDDDREFALLLFATRDTAENKGFVGEPFEQTRVLQAFAFASDGKWKEALACLEKLGDQTVETSEDDPWGGKNHRFVSAPALAERCRAKLGIPSPRPGFIREAGKPLFTSRERPIIAFEPDKVWFGDSTRLIEASSDGKTERERTLTLPAPASALLVVSNFLFLGTQGAGVIRMDKESLTQQRYGADGKILSDHITELRRIGDKIWIGYGADLANRPYEKQWGLPRRDFGDHPSGGIGFLDLPVFKFTNLLPTKSASSRDEIYYENKDGRFDQSPPNLPVLDIAESSDHSIYAAVHLRGIQRYEPAANRWSAIRRTPDTAPSSVAISDQYFCFGERAVRITGPEHAPLWIRRAGGADFRYFTTKDGLPNADVTTLLLEKDKLWIGGAGFVALLDLGQVKITQIISLQCSEVTRIARTGSNLWIAGDDAIFTLPL